LAEAILFHFDKTVAQDGEAWAARQFRKHLLAYLKNTPGAKELRTRAAAVACGEDVVAVLNEFRGPTSYGA
jgi:tRNA-dihydrouridine synthase